LLALVGCGRDRRPTIEPTQPLITAVDHGRSLCAAERRLADRADLVVVDGEVVEHFVEASLETNDASRKSGDCL